jgi:hypothetical protein
MGIHNHDALHGLSSQPGTEEKGSPLEVLPDLRAQKEELEHSLEHLHGPEEVGYEIDELAVLCLVRNGRPFVKTFVDHYLALGARHLFFLDNGSTDGTVELLLDYENVTVLRTGLPFKEYQISMKQYLFERFGQGRWALFADIDELFDYPFSETVDLGSFLRYLTERSYTAVAAQMLDMFPEKPLSDVAVTGKDEPLKEVNEYYDISNVRVHNYWDRRIVCGTGNVLANDEIKVFWKGIQSTLFGGVPPLTKHPLVFSDGKAKPMDGSSHAVSDSYVADLTCVLYHYKFTDYLYEQIRSAVREENYMKDSRKHKKRLETLEQNATLQIKRDTARKFGSVGELIENGFLVVSGDYLTWADNEDWTKNVRASEPGSYERSEVLFRARSDQRAKGAKIGRLERMVEELQSNVVDKRRRIRGLQEENRRLELQMQAIQASRTWRLLTALKLLWSKLLRRD